MLLHLLDDSFINPFVMRVLSIRTSLLFPQFLPPGLHLGLRSETYRWGFLHALDRHLVANERPDVVDAVSMTGEVSVPCSACEVAVY